MRIIGGVAGGRRIRAPRGTGTRPTTGRVREALFSVLSGQLGGFSGVVVLDLFAGSGALGLEALSRGADAALFVERKPAAARVVRENVTHLGFEDRARVWTAPVAAALVRLGRSGERFDLVFCDPPYAHDPGPLLASLVGAGVLAPDALLTLEHAPGRAPAPPHGLDIAWKRRYGDSALTLYEVRRFT